MAAVASIQSFPSISLHVSSSKSENNKRRKGPPPVFISTKPSHLNLLHLRDLFLSTNLSCHRFPLLDSQGCVEPVPLHKLSIAIRHSSVVVSVFCRPKFAQGPQNNEFGLGGLLHRAVPVSESNGQLVGFGRAVSDNGLTASIYDVALFSGYPFVAEIGYW